MSRSEKQASVVDADLLKKMLPAGCGASFLIKNQGLTQAGLIQPDHAAFVVLVWAEVHLVLEVRP